MQMQCQKIAILRCKVIISHGREKNDKSIKSVVVVASTTHHYLCILCNLHHASLPFVLWTVERADVIWFGWPGLGAARHWGSDVV